MGEGARASVAASSGDAGGRGRRGVSSGDVARRGRRRTSTRAVTLALAGVLVSALGACRDPHLRGHLPPARPSAVTVFAPRGDTLVLGDKFFRGPEVVGVHLVGKFTSRALLDQYLALSRPVGPLQGRTSTLFDILVSMEATANGDVVQWTVAGPASLIRPYVASLERVSNDRTVFYDFSAVYVPVKYCCAD